MPAARTQQTTTKRRGRMPQPAQQSNPMVERQIRRAKELAYDQEQLSKEVAANRDFLRLMEKNKELTTAQANWLDQFHPVKVKGEQRDAEEITATRKLRDEAVKEIAAERKDSSRQAA